MAVLENEDLLHLILQHARLTPAAFVAASRVSKGWRHVCQRDHMLLLSTVRERPLTKGALMGLLALRSDEADRLPREMWNRKGGGFYFLYSVEVAERAWRDMGGVEEWRTRLSKRSTDQRSIELAFGIGMRPLTLPQLFFA